MDARPVISDKPGPIKSWRAKRQEARGEDTDTDVTHGMVSARPRATSGVSRKQDVPRSYAAVTARNRLEPSDTENEYETVIRRKKRRPARVVAVPAATVTPPRMPLKPPAVIIRLKEGQTFAKTVAAVKSFVNPTELGAPVTKIRTSREGHAIFEFARTAKAHAAASKLSEEISKKLGESVGVASQLGRLAEAEVVDLDPTVTKEEVLEALRKAVPESMADAESEAALIAVTGLWSTRAGTQIATASMSRALLLRLDKLAIGWTVAKVRPRAPQPTRCYKCHGFGHDARSCTGPDLTGVCRKCGENGHREAQCATGHGRCVACEREGHMVTDHRTGSAGCLARRKAQTMLRDGARCTIAAPARETETEGERNHND